MWKGYLFKFFYYVFYLVIVTLAIIIFLRTINPEISNPLINYHLDKIFKFLEKVF